MTKEEAKSIATSSLLNNKQFLYLYSGVDDLDSSEKTMKFLVYAGKTGFFAEFEDSYKKYFAISYSDILRIEYVGTTSRKLTAGEKLGNVALLGVVGLLASVGKQEQFIISFILKDGSTIVMGFDDMDKRSVEKFLMKSLPDNSIFNKQMPIKETIETESKQDKENNLSEDSHEIAFSAADEILKYKQLLDMGAITEEEFDRKKTELLNNSN